ncbi:MAG: 4-alpha-glucanotransferase, partial [Chromatiales bacterium]|nr:4-alpha-glucanotransferase [Chromatiales bacterium]
ERVGKPLKLLCLYYALQAHFTSSGRPGGWQAWPAAYDQPDSDTVAAFAAGHGETIRYHMYLQWLARRQLEQAERAAADAGLSIGLYRDLAVGVNGGGAEAWADRELYSQMATIGAPPDPLALQGQDWGIPPMRPDILRERAYRPFIDLLRANMGHGGALRIDHVMVLYRLWWVPSGRPSSDGTYVYYDLDALMGILALESQRHRCLVIGEDLGTVPDAIRHAMPDYGVYSYRVFYFEHDEDGTPRRPESYPEQALVTVSTHDLPPLASFWSGSDIGLRRDLNLYPEESMVDETVAGRLRQKQLITARLGERGHYAGDGDDPEGEGESIDPSLAEAIQFYLASSRARLMVLQPEDWLGMDTPVNVPGTSDEHRNWSRKLTQDLEDWMPREDVRSLARRITTIRQQRP